MTIEETKYVLAFLKAAYPAFYGKLNARDGNAVLNLWSVEFSEIPVNLVFSAVKILVRTHTGYPPEIADVFCELESMKSSVTDEKSDEELWSRMKRAVSNSGYHADDEFENLPDVLKKFAGSPSGLRDFALMDSNTFNTVTRGQFFKSIKILRDRERYRNSISEPERKQIAELMARWNLGSQNLIGGSKS